MDEYYRVVQALPEPLSDELRMLTPSYASLVQEIRLRAEQPVCFTVQGKLVPCTRYLSKVHFAKWLSCEMVQNCFLHLCRYSVYAYEEELRQGFFTIQGGNRIGVAGTRSQGCFTSVTSLNLRVARWITCEIPRCVKDYLSAGNGGLLVAGAPGSGKTTFLRTLAQYLGAGTEILCVVDERGELMAQENAEHRNRQMRCDVYTRCRKEEGICMALRCMNPRYIVCDELGTSEDAAAVEQGVASGVCFLASVHCTSLQELYRKPLLAHLIKTGAFKAAVLLDGREKPGTVSQWGELS